MQNAMNPAPDMYMLDISKHARKTFKEIKFARKICAFEYRQYSGNVFKKLNIFMSKYILLMYVLLFP